MVQLTKKQSRLWIDTLNAIKSDEDEFEMDRWFEYGTNEEGTACGTAACFCGHAWLQMQGSRYERWKSGRFTPQWSTIGSVDPAVHRICKALGGFLENEAELFSRGMWCGTARNLYLYGKRYEGVMEQVKHLFAEYDVKLHPDYCLQNARN